MSDSLKLDFAAADRLKLALWQGSPRQAGSHVDIHLQASMNQLVMVLAEAAARDAELLVLLNVRSPHRKNNGRTKVWHSWTVMSPRGEETPFTVPEPPALQAAEAAFPPPLPCATFPSHMLCRCPRNGQLQHRPKLFLGGCTTDRDALIPLSPVRRRLGTCFIPGSRRQGTGGWAGWRGESEDNYLADRWPALYINDQQKGRAPNHF